MNEQRVDANIIEVSKRIQDTFEKADVWYDHSEENHFWIQWRFEIAMQSIRSNGLPLDKPLKAIDVGCGVGTLRQQIEKTTSWEMDCTDLNMSALSRIKPGRGKVYYYDILEEREEFYQKYDAVFLFDVLEHIEFDRDFIVSLSKLLKPGGYLFISVPACQFLFSVFDEVAEHYRRYSKATMSKAVANSGFEVISMEYWCFSMLPLLYLRKLLMSFSKPDPSVMMKGFEPPSKLIHSIFKLMMKCETKLIHSPPLGTSVFTTLKKT